MGDPDRYDERHPEGSETQLVVEISRSTAANDQRKAAIYARAGIPEYWRVDLVARRLEVRSQPRADGVYALTRILGRGDRLEVPGSESTLEVSGLVP